MKVYIVLDIDRDVDKVFSTEQKAVDYVINEIMSNNFEDYIEEDIETLEKEYGKNWQKDLTIEKINYCYLTSFFLQIEKVL